MNKIAGIQINNNFSDHYYLPYSIALLNSYYDKYSKYKNFEFSNYIYKRDEIHKIVNSVINNNVVLFSTYVWNINISLEIAKRLKDSNKNIKIIFGGPSVPDKSEEFLNKNSNILFVCHDAQHAL